MNLLDLPTPLLVQIWLLLALDGRIHLTLAHVCTELRALWPTVGRHLYENPKLPSFLQSMTVAISRPFPTTLHEQIVNLRFKGALTGSGSVRKCELNPDRQLAATYHEDNTLRIHHMDTGACIRTWTCPFKCSLVAWSNDSNCLAVGGENGTVAMFVVATSDVLSHTKHGDKSITDIKWNECNDTVFSVDSSGGLYAWNEPEGAIYPQAYNETIVRIEEASSFPTMSVACNPQPQSAWWRQSIATVHSTNSISSTDYVNLWRYRKHKNEGVRVRLHNGTRISMVVYSHDGETVATVSCNCVYLWKSPGRESAMILREPGVVLRIADYEPIQHILFLDDRRVLTTGEMGTVVIWDYHTGEVLKQKQGATTKEELDTCGYIVDAYVDGQEVLVVYATATAPFATIRVLKVEADEVAKKCTTPHGNVPMAAAALGSGERVLYTSFNGDAIVT